MNGLTANGLAYSSTLGFVAVYCKSKVVMGIYAGFVMLLIVALGASGLLLLAYGGVIPNDCTSSFTRIFIYIMIYMDEIVK